jgi:glycosyltransferase involved in cell wall biosynthesis
LLKGLVTTVIPVFNRPALLREAVQSVLAQSYRQIEIIIVDDGSDDAGTWETAQALVASYPGTIRAVSQANAGPGPARERGRQLAQGEFIQYLDSDDLLLPEKFELQVAGLRIDTEAGISYGLTLDEDSHTKVRTPTHGTEIARDSIFPAVLKTRLWHTVSPLYRRSVCDAIGAWSNHRIFEDWDYDCRAGLLGVRLHHCAQPVAVVRDGGDAHAGMAWKHDARAMRDRIDGYSRTFAYAKQAGIAESSPEMQQLVRSLFWMAREAGAHGFKGEAQTLFALARQHAKPHGADYTLFSFATRVLGWRLAGQLARQAEKMRGATSNSDA